MFRLSTHDRLFALLCCLVLATATSFHFSRIAVHAATVFTPQTRLGFPAGDNWEPAIAADHYGHGYVLYKHYVVAYNAAQKIFASISHDGGQTWAKHLINIGSTQQEWSLGGGAGIDSQGNIYFTWAGYSQNGQAKGPVNLFVTESRDGGQTWSLTPVGKRRAASASRHLPARFGGASPQGLTTAQSPLSIEPGGPASRYRTGCRPHQAFPTTDPAFAPGARPLRALRRRTRFTQSSANATRGHCLELRSALARGAAALPLPGCLYGWLEFASCRRGLHGFRESGRRYPGGAILPGRQEPAAPGGAG